MNPLRVHITTHGASDRFYAKAVNIDRNFDYATKAHSFTSPHDAISKIWHRLLEIQNHEDASITTDSASNTFTKAQYPYELPALTGGAWSHIEIRSDDDLSDYIGWSRSVG